jgi:hypothetical protein
MANNSSAACEEEMSCMGSASVLPIDGPCQCTRARYAIPLVTVSMATSCDRSRCDYIQLFLLRCQPAVLLSSYDHHWHMAGHGEGNNARSQGHLHAAVRLEDAKVAGRSRVRHARRSRWGAIPWQRAQRIALRCQNTCLSEPCQAGRQAANQGLLTQC